MKLPNSWKITINDSVPDYFNFGKPQGKIIFRNNEKLVVYYIYDMKVEEKIKSGQYSAFFKDKNCQEYGSWLEGGFPNFGFKDKLYLIDLCNTSPYLSNDNDYWDLSQALFSYVNRK